VGDWYDDRYYASLYSQANEIVGVIPEDPAGPTGPKQYRVVRGGSWDFVSMSLRSSYRTRYKPAVSGSGAGFRCVREVQLQKSKRISTIGQVHLGSDRKQDRDPAKIQAISHNTLGLEAINGRYSDGVSQAHPLGDITISYSYSGNHGETAGIAVCVREHTGVPQCLPPQIIRKGKGHLHLNPDDFSLRIWIHPEETFVLSMCFVVDSVEFDCKEDYLLERSTPISRTLALPSNGIFAHLF
jgi:hypothetical protein